MLADFSDKTGELSRNGRRATLDIAARCLYNPAMIGEQAALDPRVGRSRQAVLAGFRRLAFTRRYDAIRTTELIAMSGVGRSTFYKHFRGKDDVLLASVEAVLEPLANAAAGRGSKAQVCRTLEHVWQQRALGRMILGSDVAPRLQRRLGAMIEARLDEGSGTAPKAMRATAAAAGQLAMLRIWVTGEAPCSPQALAQQIMKYSALSA